MHLFAMLILSLTLQAGIAQAEPAVAGYVKTVEGDGRILRGDASLPARVGDVLRVSDAVATGEDSTVGIMLEDDTLLSLGPDSRLELGDFAFEPQEDNLSVAVRLLKGSFAYMSGVIARLAPDKVRIETPDAVIAVHGTSMLVKVEE